MSRLTKIEGEFHGVKFEVNPTPIGIDEIQEELDQMMIEWYEENEPDYVDTFKEGLSQEEIKNMQDDELAEKMRQAKAWMKDEDFRAKYLKKKMDYAVDFKGKVDDSVWKDKMLALSTIQEAWDFFCGNRRIPQDGLQVR